MRDDPQGRRHGHRDDRPFAGIKAAELAGSIIALTLGGYVRVAMVEYQAALVGTP